MLKIKSYLTLCARSKTNEYCEGILSIKSNGNFGIKNINLLKLQVSFLFLLNGTSCKLILTTLGRQFLIKITINLEPSVLDLKAVFPCFLNFFVLETPQSNFSFRTQFNLKSPFADLQNNWLSQKSSTNPNFLQIMLSLKVFLLSNGDSKL